MSSADERRQWKSSTSKLENKGMSDSPTPWTCSTALGGSSSLYSPWGIVESLLEIDESRTPGGEGAHGEWTTLLRRMRDERRVLGRSGCRRRVGREAAVCGRWLLPLWRESGSSGRGGDCGTRVGLGRRGGRRRAWKGKVGLSELCTTSFGGVRDTR
jgi:hypothetical protein